MPAVEDGKLDTFAGSKYMERETYKREENNKNGSPLMKLLMQRSAHVDIVPCSYLIK
jgi:hypothetical protein